VREAIEGPVSEVDKYLNMDMSCHYEWNTDESRFRATGVPDEWKPWGCVAANVGNHLMLRDKWLSWMACTGKILQTVDNKHLNRHLDYLYAGPTINFVDLQCTPQIGRRMEILAHLVECMNNHGELPMDCVVPTRQTEILFGQNKSNRLVRGMRIKHSLQSVSRSIAPEDARVDERFLKSFRRGVPEVGQEDMADPDQDLSKKDAGMVETQMVRMVVRFFPVVHPSFKGIGRVISLIGLPGVNVAKCLQRVCDPRYSRPSKNSLSTLTPQVST
jgi:hypothetical protein